MGSRSKIFVWSLFDFANTSYSIVVVTFLYAVYFKKTVSLGQPIGDLYWSIGISVAMLITAILSPILGAIADHSAGKKRFLLFFTLLCVVSTSLLFFVGEGMIFWGVTLFILSNIGFEAGLVFYDAFLPELTSLKNYGRVSGYGYAMGYVGSLVTLAIAFPFIQLNMIKETFPIAAVFFLFFSLPLFIFLKDNRKNVEHEQTYLRIGFNRVYNTIKNLKDYKNLAMFLLAFFFYIEGVNTVIFFSGNYAQTTLGFSFEELALFFLIVQTTAIIGSTGFGVLSDSIGQKTTITISLVIWIFTMLVAYLTSEENNFLMNFLMNASGGEFKVIQTSSFYVVGLLAGSVMGATQSVSRSLMSKLTPANKKTEFFGFYSFFGKSSAILGPLVFGFVSFVTESQRLAILSISIFFIIGLVLLKWVDDKAVEE
ncbi:MAG: MFS transporter [Bacteroidetes bacterium]|nr:MFS transporter [Bacteroidota bacterium]